VFGGAILLHDAALCFEAYCGGREGIRKTVEWKDAYAHEQSVKPLATDDEWKSYADFVGLRSLHAKQAERLAEKAWPDSDTGQPMFLLEDSTLRKHLGPLMGEIASSHHLDIEVVRSKFRNQVNAIPQFPREWRIDPLKLACLLRCADAAHISQDRAPDFLHALLRRSGISFNHWQAQNRLAGPDLDQSDKTKVSVLFTSTRPFLMSEVPPWWVAYDATCLIDKEIRASNAILEAQNIDGITRAFQVKRVKGVESAERMAEFIKTEGWTPCSAMLHVANVEQLVANLGGRALYGTGTDELGIVLRELIQNARDAIQARRFFEPEFNGDVRLHIVKSSESVVLYVDDDGIGMSYRVLTGPLLDFGSSFWFSSLVKEEFPGLRSSSFRSVGRFGVGIYSVFMIADYVRVASRRWDEAQNAVNQLVFQNGVTLRPLLIRGKPTDMPGSVSTRIELRLRNGLIGDDGKIEIQRNVMHGVGFRVDFSEYLFAICAGLDVAVSYSNGSGYVQLHSPQPLKEELRADWLRKLSFARYQEPSVEKYIQANHSRLRPISHEGRCFGLAAISTEFSRRQDFLSLNTIGGLTTAVHHRGQNDFFGYIDHAPKSAKRDQGDFSAPESAIQEWAQEQLAILLRSKINPLEQCIAAAALANFKIDPSPIFRAFISFGGKFYLMTLSEVISFLDNADLGIVKPRAWDFADFHGTVQALPNHGLIIPQSAGTFYSVTLERGTPRDQNSALGIIHRELLNKGKKPRWSVQPDVAFSQLFREMDAVVVSIR